MNENSFTGESSKSNLNMSNNQQKQYILCLDIKIDNNTTKTINIKNLNECPSLLENLKIEGNIINDKVKKLIQEKINKAYELLTRKIYELGIKNYTYKNLCEIYHQIIYENNRKRKNNNNEKVNILKRNKSYKETNKMLENEKKLVLDNVRNIGALNITF